MIADCLRAVKPDWFSCINGDCEGTPEGGIIGWIKAGEEAAREEVARISERGLRDSVYVC